MAAAVVVALVVRARRAQQGQILFCLAQGLQHRQQQAVVVVVVFHHRMPVLMVARAAAVRFQVQAVQALKVIVAVQRLAIPAIVGQAVVAVTER